MYPWRRWTTQERYESKASAESYTHGEAATKQEDYESDDNVQAGVAGSGAEYEHVIKQEPEEGPAAPSVFPWRRWTKEERYESEAESCTHGEAATKQEYESDDNVQADVTLLGDEYEHVIKQEPEKPDESTRSWSACRSGRPRQREKKRRRLPSPETVFYG